MWKSVIEVLNIVELEGSTSDQRAEACRLLDAMDSFRFVFILNMMIDLMGITNDLSQALQRKKSGYSERNGPCSCGKASSPEGS